MATGPDAVLRELDGLRALARALVAGGGDADDLLQNTALAALEHPPDVDRPVRPWLAAVLRNRRRMDRRTESRRQRRDLAAVPDETIQPDDPIDRARTLERLSTALVALDEPFRTAVIRRYLDDESAADIARALGVPAGTVRWRLKTGLDRLRAALDETSPRWRHAVLLFAPTLAKKGPLLVKVKTSLVFAALLLLCIGASVWLKQDRSPASSTAASRSAAIPKPHLAGFADDAGVPVVDPLPGQGRVRVVADPVPGGLVGGRVINWSSGEGVAGAELTFTGDTGAVTIRSRADGTFELAPPSPGAFTLTAAAAPGFLPYAPEYQHSTVHLVLAKDRAVRGLTVFLYPALDYRGRVVDAAGAPVAGAHVRLLGTPTGEQTIDRLATEWTSAADGTFRISRRRRRRVRGEIRGTAQRGWAILDGSVATTKQLVIKLGDAAARDATITGKDVDPAGHPIADVLVSAAPVYTATRPVPRASSFATSGADGSFVLDHLDRSDYLVASDVEGAAPVQRTIAGGSTDITR